jgi:hypothetical protein
LEVKIRHNATEKYATTIKTAWNVKFLGLNDKNISITGKSGGCNFMKIAQVGLFFQYSAHEKTCMFNLC